MKKTLPIQNCLNQSWYKCRYCIRWPVNHPNGSALKVRLEEHKVELREFPEDVLRTLKKLITGVIEGLATDDTASAKIYASW